MKAKERQAARWAESALGGGATEVHYDGRRYYKSPTWGELAREHPLLLLCFVGSFVGFFALMGAHGIGGHRFSLAGAATLLLTNIALLTVSGCRLILVCKRWWRP